MVIQKPGRGRPSRQFILDQVDLGMRDLARTGGLPAPVENQAIWRDIWYEEVHNSTAIEGNTLALKQVKILLDEGRSVGNKELCEYLEVKAYAQAAEWVYAQGRMPGEWGASEASLSLTELRHIHRLTVSPVWEFFPPNDLHPDEGPGNFRCHDIAQFGGGMRPPSFTDVPAEVADWLRLVNSEPGAAVHPLLALASIHAGFERIHPFRDGNGRVGRLILNLLLVRQGYPAAVLRNRSRPVYLRALQRADAGDPWPLAEMLGRAVMESLDRFLLPSLAGPAKLLPISALALPTLPLRSIRVAAERGRLRAIKDEAGRWMSTRQWVDDYRRTRRVGRPPKGTPTG